MPIYEYRCQTCGAPKEAIQKMNDAPLTVCEACGAETLVRVMSRTSFVLKGTGWYATDYKPAAKSDSKSEPKADTKSGSETKSESKTEASPRAEP